VSPWGAKAKRFFVNTIWGGVKGDRIKKMKRRIHSGGGERSRESRLSTSRKPGSSPQGRGLGGSNNGVRPDYGRKGTT